MIVSNDVLYKDRRAILQITLLNANGDPLDISQSSGSLTLRFGTTNRLVLSIDSGTATAGGSFFPFENPFALVLSEIDMGLFTPGIWTLEALAIDSQSRTFHVESRTMEVRNPLP